MKAVMRKYFQVSNTEIEVLNLCELECGIDYEVVSETIFDYEGNEYMSRDELPASLKASGDYIAHPDLIAGNTAFFFNRKINLPAAKKCKLGVLELQLGKHKGKQFLFPVYDMDLEVQLMAYEALTIGKVIRPFIKILQHPDHLKYIQLVLGVTTFKELAAILDLNIANLEKAAEGEDEHEKII